MSGLQARREKLGRRGIISFEIDGVLARLTKGQSSTELGRQEFIPKALFGGQMLRDVRDRVTKRQQLGEGDRFKGYASKSRAILSAEYAQAAGVNAKVWRTERHFHRRLRSPEGSFVVTGGMWAGAEARLSGKKVVLEFVGSSQARAAETPNGRPKSVSKRIEYETKTGKKGSRWSRTAVPGTVTNRRKAGRIWFLMRVNVLNPTKAEVQQLADKVLGATKLAVVTAVIGGNYRAAGFG